MQTACSAGKRGRLRRVWFHFCFSLVEKWRESGPITERSGAKQMESRITKDTPLKIFLNTDCLLITLQFAILHLISH